MSDEDTLESVSHFLIDPYGDFIKSENVPIIEGYAVDCLDIELGHWDRMGAEGAYVLLEGRGDYCDGYVVEMGPGGQTKPQRHLYDAVYYALAGRGACAIETPEGRKYSFEFGPHATFGIPLNARYQLFNGSGSEPCRLGAVTTAPIVLNFFHNVDFVFDNDFVFPERFGKEHHYQGEGEFLPVRPGRHQWETNLVPDLTSFELPEWKERGAGGKNIMFTLADSPMHLHISEFGVGTYKKGHRHNAGANIFLVSGSGYSLLWQEGDDPLDTVKVDWKPGVFFAPPDGPTYHQHFNTSAEPARYYVLGLSGSRYPVLPSRMRQERFRVTDRSVKEGGNQIEYQDEDPRILERFEAECLKAGSQSKMREFLKQYGR
jgi:mannose-6-phosphate isomerase-like protein (cupin superfamily)